MELVGSGECNPGRVNVMDEGADAGARRAATTAKFRMAAELECR